MPEQRAPYDALVVLPFADGPRTVVVVAGDVDGGSAARLRDQLLRTIGFGTRSLVVDLNDLGVCDPQGTEALTAAVQVAQARGVAVRLRGEPPDVAQRLRTAGSRP